MSIDTETFARYAKAEKDLCQKASAVLTKVIKEIEDTHGIKIAEVRVTMDPSNSANGWTTLNVEHSPSSVHVRERSSASFSRQ
jgi:hypothetical protein